MANAPSLVTVANGTNPTSPAHGNVTTAREQA
jgi:hypothetical protein